MEKISIQKIKWIKRLHLKKYRAEEKLILVEGMKLVLELSQQFPDLVHSFYVDKNEEIELDPSFICFSCSTSELERISQFNTAPTMIGVFKEPSLPEFDSTKRILVLESIQDPGNLGTIIRTADWFGLQQIVCSKDTVHCYNSKVIQASMGSAFRIPVFYENLDEFLPKWKLPIHGALLNGVHMNEIDPSEIKILVMGNEGKGISEMLQRHISQAVTIPGYGQAESLNVSIATGILLHHWSQSKKD